ncbi:MAG: adenylosuccinate lyase [Candidatus Neomarinimicrobiota bacterium]|nr:adenylosuccinate lyase [Candidatus Neomarinimicrobiota bacterium]
MSDPLKNISPLDGRYSKSIESLSDYFSESALIKYRTMVEIEYLISLSEQKEVKDLEPMSETDKQKLRKIYKSFSLVDAKRVKAIEVATNHDVKAVEYYIRERLEKMNKKRMFPWIHFALTSEDINNLSYSLMWQEALKIQFIPVLHEVIKKLNSIAKQFSTTPMLSLTHGQSATPTTFGKEISVFVHRLSRQHDQIKKHKLQGKFGGATGTWAAHYVAYPKKDWLQFSKKFITSLGLDPNLVTTQVEPHDSVVESYHSIIRVNNILIDLCRDIWSYVSRGILKQKRVPGEIGSSTMPHKINPIQFENAEGNLGLAVSILSHLSNKLPISRMQRDLTDSTTLRNQGIAMGYGYLACKNILKGLRRITINKTEMKKELNTHWEVLAEAVQTILRKSGSENAYEQLKNMTRGETVTQESILDFVKLLRIPEEDKNRLSKLTPEEYIGIAPTLVNLK